MDQKVSCPSCVSINILIYSIKFLPMSKTWEFNLSKPKKNLSEPFGYTKNFSDVLNFIYIPNIFPRLPIRIKDLRT
jgi:hypothetical protein